MLSLFYKKGSYSVLMGKEIILKKNNKILFVTLLLLVIVAAVPAQAAKLKKYKAKKVTAKQIVTELKKVNKVGKIYKHKKADLTTGQINSYKSKYSFYDKKYKDAYCTVEVFDDAYDANRRAAYLDSLYFIYSMNEVDYGTPEEAFRYKNILFRYPQEMPYKYAATYYKNIKKIVK